MSGRNWKKYNFAEDKNFDISQVSLVAIVILIAIAFIVNGCEKQEPIHKTLDSGSVLECRDGHLYSIVSKTRYELIEKDGCTSGKINLKD